MHHGCPNMRHEKITALGRAEMADRGSRDRGSDVIALQPHHLSTPM